MSISGALPRRTSLLRSQTLSECQREDQGRVSVNGQVGAERRFYGSFASAIATGQKCGSASPRSTRSPATSRTCRSSAHGARFAFEQKARLLPSHDAAIELAHMGKAELSQLCRRFRAAPSGTADADDLTILRHLTGVSFQLRERQRPRAPQMPAGKFGKLAHIEQQRRSARIEVSLKLLRRKTFGGGSIHRLGFM